MKRITMRQLSRFINPNRAYLLPSSWISDADPAAKSFFPFLNYKTNFKNKEMEEQDQLSYRVVGNGVLI